MNTIYVSKDKLEQRKKEKENCLNFLYYIEAIFDFNYPVITKCIDELQDNLQFKEDKRKEVKGNGK